MQPSAGVAQLVYLLDEAFMGTHWHSLLSNLRSLSQEDWRWVPAGGQRTIQDIVQHIGSCKLMYHNHAFGDAQLTWDDPFVAGGETLATSETAIPWLQEGHHRLRDSIVGLDDSELLRLRMTSWGELKETRWIIGAMIEHDLYHAGEINHLRSLRHEHDQWAYASE